MLKIPWEASQSNTHACRWCTSSCSSALRRCRLPTATGWWDADCWVWNFSFELTVTGSDTEWPQPSSGEETWIKNSSDLSRPDAQVHESIMSLHECVRSHHESLHNNHWVDCWLGWLCVLSLGHNAQEKIKCNKYVKVKVLDSFSSTWLTVRL